MGMFDNVRCEFPLPVLGANELYYQTKDLDCDLLELRIGPNGQLWRKLYEWDDKTGEDKEIGQEHKRWSGSMNFYTHAEGKAKGWIEFQAHFVEGKLTHLHLVELRDWPAQEGK